MSILASLISVVSLAEAVKEAPSPNQCKAAQAANNILMPENKYSPYLVFIQLRQQNFGNPPVSEPPAKNETKVQKERRELQNQTNLTDFQNKLNVLNDIRKTAGLKVLTLSDFDWEPSKVYETNPKLEEMREKLNKQKSEVDQVILTCFQNRLQKGHRRRAKKRSGATGSGLEDPCHRWRKNDA